MDNIIREFEIGEIYIPYTTNKSKRKFYEDVINEVKQKELSINYKKAGDKFELGQYRINREFTINTYVDKYFKDLADSLEKENITKDDVDRSFKYFYKFFDECIVKDEYYVCNNISEKIGLLFKNLIEHCNKMLLNNEEEMAEYIFQKIINSGIYQISYAKDSKTESLISNLFIQQEKNIKICIKIGKLDWFKKYIKQINLLSREYKNNHNGILEELYDLNMEIGKTLLEKEEE